MNSHTVSSIVILFDEQSYYFIVMFQVYKSMLLYRKENITKMTFFSWSYLLILLEIYRA